MTDTFDLASLRSEFPVTKRMLYLDSAHQTPMATVVRAALNEFLVEGNESAGPKPVWVRRVETARENVAKLFNASSSEIAFTKNTSEGLNIAANAVPFKAGDNVILIEGETPFVTGHCGRQQLAAQCPFFCPRRSWSRKVPTQ